MPYIQLAALLAALATVGPFSIDTYLPALHAIGTELKATPLEVQQTLTAYMLPMGAMVLWHGAFSDAWGRKPVIVVSMLLFALASVVCVFAGSIEALLVGRALQGISAGAGMVVGRAVVRDLMEGPKAQRLMSHVSMAFAIGPAVAPILGGWIHAAFGWRAVFIFLALLGLALAALSAWRLQESHPPAARQPLHPGPLARRYRSVFSSPGFLLLSVAVSLNFNAFFIYVLSAPVFLMTHLGLSETEFGWMFVPGVIGMMSGSALSARLAGRLSAPRTIRLGYSLMLAAAALNLAVSLLLPPGLPQSVLPIMAYNFGMAIAMPSLTLLALDHFPTHRGLASSCQSFVQMLISSVTAGLIAPALWGSVGNMAAGMGILLLLGLGCFMAWWWLFHRSTPSTGQA
ncbi:MAG: multidrug effflux MFS transporter [Zoogloea sp.]|uniref:multidrug effflux MFS transporter n=1 Tax=Zoogloea sp. TaxID=49181 RepID=UPI0026260B14|nr:multidrug effflux MFS transporter [Zoogloea sp.]MDD2988809.1 multidrug effflux MFS transporter [Zoogloea sp.]